MSTKKPDKDVVRSWKSEQQTRTFALKRNAIDADARTVDLAFSSETPYERWFGFEVLDHNIESVRLERLNSGGALLVNHNTDDHIGVIESARIDGDNVGRAVARFGKGARASEIFNDVIDGIRSQVSVGYMVHEMILEKSSDDGPPTYRVTDYEPLEISLVAVPADATIGVGRQHEFEDKTMTTKKVTDSVETKTTEQTKQTEPQPAQKSTAQAQQPAATPIDRDAELKALREAEAERCSQIDTLSGHFPFLADKAKEAKVKGISADQFNREALELMKTRAENKATNYGEASNGRIEMNIPRRRFKMKAFSNDRAGEEQAYRAGMWARAAIMGDEDAQRWCKAYSVRVMTGTTAANSSVVPDEMIMPIIDLREQYGLARQVCSVYPMGSDTATVPRRVSGVTAYFPGRTTATTESEPAFDDVTLVAREVSALTRISNSYAQDAVINLADHIAGEMALAFAEKEDDCLFNGTGADTYGGIYGIRAKIIDGNHTAGAVDAASGIDTFAEVTADDLSNVSSELPDFPGISGTWYTSKKGNALVFDALKAAAGGNTITDLAGRPARQWLGDPITLSQKMPKVTTDLSNVAMMIYGDLNMGVLFGDRMGFEVQVLNERYAEYRQTGIIATERMDIVVHGLGDNTNAGPIVALIGE